MDDFPPPLEDLTESLSLRFSNLVSVPSTTVLPPVRTRDTSTLLAFKGLTGAFSTSTNTNTNTKSPKPRGAGKGLVIKEVQESMKGTNVDWCTPQILEEMMKDPVLKEGLTNPAIAGIMQDMAKDPKVLFLNFFFKN